jgi:hypothetical protein
MKIDRIEITNYKAFILGRTRFGIRREMSMDGLRQVVCC